MAVVQNWIQRLKQQFSRVAANVGGGELTIRQVIIPIIGLIIFVLVAYYAISQVRVNGPIFNQIKTVDDLRGDLSPPPLFIVEPYALAQNMHLALVDGNGDRMQILKKRFDENEKRYAASVQRWNKTRLPKNLIQPYKAVVASGKAFFTLYKDQMLPALQTGFVGTSSRALVELEKAYVANNELVQTFVTSLEAESQETASNANKLLQYFLIGLALLALIIGAAMYFIGKRQNYRD